MSGRNFVKQEFCQAGILSGRNFVRKGFLSGMNFVRQGFCQAGILSGRNFVRQGFCQEAGSARKESQPWSCVCCLLSFFGGEGRVSFRGGEGGWGRVSFGVGCETVVVVVYFLFFGGGGASQLPGWVSCLLRGMEASQLPGVRRGDGGESALELGVVVVYFLFLGGEGRVSFRENPT